MRMSVVLSIRVPKELKEELDEVKDVMDVKKEVIEFLKKRVAYYRKVKALRRAHAILAKHTSVPKGTAWRSVREDRDSH